MAKKVRLLQATTRSRKDQSAAVAIVPDQHTQAIDRRRRIREAFHDSKAQTIKANGHR
jgi:hypothetical protein